VRDVQDPSVRALGKLMAMLPARLRARLETLTRATSSVPGRVVPVESAVLQEIAGAIQSGLRVRFTYRDAHDAVSHREVEPYRLLLSAGRWYLFGWDPERDGWRSFRIDRMRLKSPHGRPFTARPAPPGGLDGYATRSLAGAMWAARHRVRLLAPAEQMRGRAPVSVDIVADGPDACIATVGSSDAAMLARYLSWWDADFEILDSADLLAEVRALARRYTAAGKGLAGPRPGPVPPGGPRRSETGPGEVEPDR
jgi:predicted DNA-binding transcriptional regulator YafY